MDKIVIASLEDRLTVAAILIKSGYTVRQGKQLRAGKKSYEYYVEYEPNADAGGGRMKAVFTIAGEPMGKGRPQFSTYGGRITARTPQRTVAYENLVKMEYKAQAGLQFPDDAMLSVRIFAYLSIPKSVSKKKRTAMLEGLIRPTKKPDHDNIGKIVCDALNGIAYRDDAQIVDSLVRKFYSDKPCVLVEISDIPYKT